VCISDEAASPVEGPGIDVIVMLRVITRPWGLFQA
jgi:hypothetical protein